MRKYAISAGVIGLVLLIAAGLMSWWITPSFIARMPGGYNTTRTYDATLRTLFDPAAMASGNLASAIQSGLPGAVTETVKVQQTSGNTALVLDTRTLTVAGRTAGRMVSSYSLDRRTLEATSSHPANWTVTPATGLTVSWPLGAKQQNYTGWVPQTGTTTTLKYVKQVQQGGINTYEYQATVPATPIKNAQLLASMPKFLPAALLPKMTAAGIISPAVAASFASAFPNATLVPLSYSYQAANTYYVAPETGLVVDLSNNETQMAGVTLPNGKFVPVLPVLAYSYHASPTTLTDAVNDANNGSGTITTFGVSVPIAAAATGFVLLVLAVFLWMRGSGRGRPAGTARPERHPVPAGGTR